MVFKCNLFFGGPIWMTVSGRARPPPLPQFMVLGLGWVTVGPHLHRNQGGVHGKWCALENLPIYIYRHTYTEISPWEPSTCFIWAAHPTLWATWPTYYQVNRHTHTLSPMNCHKPIHVHLMSKYVPSTLFLHTILSTLVFYFSFSNEISLLILLKK